MIHLYIDFKCPAAYLALKPTCALCGELGIPVNWHAIRSYQSPLIQEKADEEVGERHRRVRALARQKTHMLYAEIQNLPLQFRNPPTNTDMALAALSLLSESGADPLPFVTAAFDAYWTGDADLNDAAVVAKLSGAPTFPDNDENGYDVHTRLEVALGQAEENGIFTSPTYVVNEQIFVGREHLPWIGELLQT